MYILYTKKKYIMFGDNFYPLIVSNAFFSTGKGPILLASISAELFKIFGRYLFFITLSIAYLLKFVESERDPYQMMNFVPKSVAQWKEGEAQY